MCLPNDPLGNRKLAGITQPDAIGRQDAQHQAVPGALNQSLSQIEVWCHRPEQDPIQARCTDPRATGQTSLAEARGIARHAKLAAEGTREVAIHRLSIDR